jgi:hypothetical protein
MRKFLLDRIFPGVLGASLEVFFVMTAARYSKKILWRWRVSIVCPP